MVISYSIWKYLLGIGSILLIYGLWRMLSGSTEAEEARAMLMIMIAAPLIIAGLLFAFIAKSRN